MVVSRSARIPKVTVYVMAPVISTSGPTDCESAGRFPTNWISSLNAVSCGLTMVIVI